MKIVYHCPEKLDRSQNYVRLASWFGCGFLSPAPGTWGSLGGLAWGVVIAGLLGVYGLFIGIFIVSVIGYWAAGRFDDALGTQDSKMIVIDEVAGQWIAMIPALGSLTLILLSFLLFRLFDITKPWPVSYFENDVKGPAGVMGDDIVAGMMAAVCVLVVGYVF